MRLVTLMLALSCALANTAVASARPLHLTVGQLRLEPLAELAALLQLATPKLGRAPLHALHLTLPSPATVTRSAGNRPQRASLAPNARLASRMYIGDTWSFRNGRELSLHLTPNEGHCAPLMRLTF